MIFSSRYLAPTPFSNLSVRAALVVALVRALAGEQRDQLVLAHLEIAEVHALHAALEQRLGLARRVQVVGDFLVVDLAASTESSAKNSPTSIETNTATWVLAGNSSSSSSTNRSRFRSTTSFLSAWISSSSARVSAGGSAAGSVRGAAAARRRSAAPWRSASRIRRRGGCRGRSLGGSGAALRSAGANAADAPTTSATEISADAEQAARRRR